jgi:putative hydrolase of the HAD superfamily
MIKGVVFDLDATLSDRKRVLSEVGKEFYNQKRELLNNNLSLEAFIEVFLESDLNKNHYGWEAMGEWLYEKNVFEKKEYWVALFNFVHEYYKVIGFAEEDAEIVLSELKNRGYKLGIITNGTKECQGSKLKLLNFDKYIDHTIICQKIRKPNIKPFSEMAEALNLKPQELMYVGDNPLNDVEGSRNAGYIPVWMKKYALWIFPEIKKCDYEITSLSELLHILK